MTKMIKASEFEAECMKVMDEVAETGESVVITKDGVPIIQLVPAQPVAEPGPVEEKPKTLLGAMKGEIEILGDIISPIYAEWAAATDISETNEPAALSEGSTVAADLPPAGGKPKSLYGLMKGRIRSTGDIVSPLDEEWDVLK